MFSLSYDSLSKLQGTITVKKMSWDLGTLTDTNGNRWNVRGHFSRDGIHVVQAVPENELHPYYNDTSGSNYSGLISQKWEPYLLKEKN